MGPFRDRIDGGRHLAAKLLPYAEEHRIVVLGLARGGVAVAEQVAVALGVDYDVLVMGEVWVPGRSDLVLAMVTSGGVEIVDHDVMDEFEIGPETFRKASEAATREVLRREELYRGDREPLRVTGTMVVLVDDGMESGTTMRAAVEVVRLQRPARILVAVPVAPFQVCEELRSIADAVIAVHTPEPFYGIGQWYEEFPKISDSEIQETLARSWRTFVRPDSPLA